MTILGENKEHEWTKEHEKSVNNMQEQKKLNVLPIR
jgi:hypothetical protein